VVAHGGSQLTADALDVAAGDGNQLIVGVLIADGTRLIADTPFGVAVVGHNRRPGGAEELSHALEDGGIPVVVADGGSGGSDNWEREVWSSHWSASTDAGSRAVAAGGVFAGSASSLQHSRVGASWGK
jgi:hypothetical protein